MQYLDYLPDVFKETREYRALAGALGPLADGVREAVGEVPEAYFPTTAEELLPRWERVLGLRESGTLEERRFAVLSRLAGVRPYTIERLKRQLAASMGEGNFQAEVYPEDFLLRVTVTPGAEGLMGAMARELRRMIPANITLEAAVGTLQKAYAYGGAVLAVSEKISL